MFSGRSNFVETFQFYRIARFYSWPLRSSVQSMERIIIFFKISLRACEQFPMPGIPTVGIGMAAVES